MSEGQHTEWKASWRDECLKWLCGFANAQGGVLEIGRDDRGRIVGIEDAPRLLEELPNKLRDLLGIVADFDLREEDGKPYLRIAVEPYPVPISYRGEYHYRSGSTKQVLRGAALDRFLGYLKRAGVLLFHPDPERFVTGASIKIGYFADEADLRYHDEITGDVFSQPGKALEILLTKYLKAGISYEGIQRILGACRAAGTPEPRIEVDGRDFWFEFPFSADYLESVASTGVRDDRTGRTTQETTQETPQERILGLLRAEPELTRKALAERIGISADGVKYHLTRLREAGRIRHVGPTKKGRWEILGDRDG